MFGRLTRKYQMDSVARPPFDKYQMDSVARPPFEEAITNWVTQHKIDHKEKHLTLLLHEDRSYLAACEQPVKIS